MTANLPAAATQPDRTPKRVRHTLRFRALEVIKTERITPHLLRITVGGDELADFVSPGFDDHVKLFFPNANGALSLPTAGPDGPIWPDGVKPTMRDYTPRGYYPVAKTLEIDFALHLAGPATTRPCLRSRVALQNYLQMRTPSSLLKLIRLKIKWTCRLLPMCKSSGPIAMQLMPECFHC